MITMLKYIKEFIIKYKLLFSVTPRSRTRASDKTYKNKIFRSI